MRIALIGLGDIAQKAYLPIVANHPKIKPILCTRNEEILSRLAHKYHINEVYKSVEELIHNRPDAVMIHSATESHYAIVKKFLDAKIPVFVDKPLCYSLPECEELLSLSIKNKTLLYLGFNRRFIPVIQKLKQEDYPYQITWQKNRVNLPGDPRVFIFDDFIHVIDSLLYLGNGMIEDLHVRYVKNKSQLEVMQVQWRQGTTLLQGNMNRVSGHTQEVVEYNAKAATWIIKDFTHGSYFKEDREEMIKVGSWDSTLYTKGFYNLIEDWIKALQENEFSEQRVNEIRATHELCEKITLNVIGNNS